MLVAGHRRIHSNQGTRGDYLYFVHIVDEGLITLLSAHTSREAALERLQGERERGG